MTSSYAARAEAGGRFRRLGGVAERPSARRQPTTGSSRRAAATASAGYS